MTSNNIDNRVSVAMTIAGSDSSAGAGIQADIKSAAAVGCYMTTAITALTAQNSMGVEMIEAVSAEMIGAQIDAVAKDMLLKAAKTGMIPNKEAVDVVVERVERYKIDNLVVDPVMVSTSGSTLIDDNAIKSIIDNLFPKALIVTPNIIECSYITGVKIEKFEDFELAAAKFKNFGSKYLLLKGGHIDSDKIADILYDFATGERHIFEFDRINSINTHGTGCSLSSAIAACLSQGRGVVESVTIAEDFVHRAIERGKDLVYGAGHGSISHLF